MGGAARPAAEHRQAPRQDGRLEIEIYDRFDEAAGRLRGRLQSSWKPEEAPSTSSRALAEQEGAAGNLRLGVALKNGGPLAVQLWLVENGEATIHKLAYAEDARAMSPGTLLGMEMFRRALDVDRVSAIDYGTGDDGYKKDWMAERRTLWRIEAFNSRTPQGLIGWARASLSKLVRRKRSG